MLFRSNFPPTSTSAAACTAPDLADGQEHPFVQCKFDEWEHYRRTVSFKRAFVLFKKTESISYKETNGMRRAPTCLPFRKCGTGRRERTTKRQPESASKTHIRRTKRVRYKEDGTTYRSGNIPERTETGGRTTVQGPRRFCRKRKKPLLFSGFSL